MQKAMDKKAKVEGERADNFWRHPGPINALTKMLVVSHEAKRSGVQKARNGTPLALRA